VTDNCLAMMLPVGLTLRALDMSGGRITSRGAALLSGGYTQLTSLDLCGGHITGVRGGRGQKKGGGAISGGARR